MAHEKHSIQVLRLGAAFLIAAFGATSAVSAEMPEGMRGWWYHVAYLKSGFAPTPEEACARNAANHFGVPLLDMKARARPNPTYECIYKNPIGGMVFDYFHTRLECASGYSAKWPGICVRSSEVSRPQSCSPDQPGFVMGNPVVVASGAKIHTETDIPGLPGGALKIQRTYRSFKEGGASESGGRGWTFSFDRSFMPIFDGKSSAGTPPTIVAGAFGDGSFFEFRRTVSGAYISTFDPRQALTSENANYDEWILTTQDGSLERFKKISGKFLLVSSHPKSGGGHSYNYGPDNRLQRITDLRTGRGLTVTWARSTVAAITGPTSAVHYAYQTPSGGEADDTAIVRLLSTVEFVGKDSDRSKKRYHYEDENYSHLLTGITDENGARFATYAYDGTGRVLTSEHSGGGKPFRIRISRGNQACSN